MRKQGKHNIKCLCNKVLAVVLSAILTIGLLADLGSVKAASEAVGGVTARAGESWAGSGTEEDPWIIENSEDLALLAQKVNAGTKYSGKFFKVSDDAQNLRSTVPIGMKINNTDFRGTFDGNGKTIELAITDDGTMFGCGLFGVVYGAHVKNVRVTGSVSGGTYAAGIAAYVSYNTIIENCVNEADISGSYVAGIAVFHGSATTTTTIQNCYNSGTISGVRGAGGIAASAGIDVRYCYNIGDVTNTGNHAAGILATRTNGWNDSEPFEISNCLSLSLKVSENWKQTDGWTEDAKRVASNEVGSKATLSNNRAREDMLVGPVGAEKKVYSNDPEYGLDKKNGADASVTGSSKTSDIFKDWDPDIWNIPDGNFEIGCELPTLKTVPVDEKPVLPGVPAHEHDFKWNFDAAGHWHECDCGQNAGDKAAHNMDSGTVVKEATETEDGQKVFRCTDECGYEYRETLPATGRKPDGGNTDVSGGDAEKTDVSGGDLNPENPDVSGGDADNPDIGGGDQKPDNPDIGGEDSKPDNPDIGGEDSKTENPDVGGEGSDQPTGKPEDPNNPGGATDNPADSSGSSDDDSGHGNGTNKNVSRPGADTEPKTGDTRHTEYWATLAMIAGLGYLLCLFMEERKGMTEEEKNEKVAALIAWAKRGGRMRRYVALAVIFLLLTYYHSIGKQTAGGWQKLYQV